MGHWSVVARTLPGQTRQNKQAGPADDLGRPKTEEESMAGIRGLFIPGPTNVPERVRRAMDVPMEDQRAPDLPDFTLPLFQDLKRIFQTQEGQVFLFPSSGTGGWEAAITNTLSPGDKVLAARFGQFSHLWIDLCQRHGLEVEIVDA